MLVSSQPYLKQYIFPFWSLGTLIRLLVIVIAVVLPFFLAYATPNFYLSRKLITFEETISYNYQYHVQIDTSSGAFVYTNLYTSTPTNPPAISTSDNKKVMIFGLTWPKQPDYQVKGVKVSLFFNFDLNGVTHFGSVSAQSKGYDLADISIAGQLNTVQGEGVLNMTKNSLILVNYDLASFASQAHNSTAYLEYDYSVVPINLPTDLLTVNLALNYASLIAYQSTPSIMGQLVWSWVQYCPLFLSLYFLLDRVFAFLVRQQILKRSVIHDKDYMTLVAEQNERRSVSRLR